MMHQVAMGDDGVPQLDTVAEAGPLEPTFLARPPHRPLPHPTLRTVLKLGKRLRGVAPLRWKASKCLRSSGGCRGREANRGLEVLEAGPAAGGRRAGSEPRSHGGRTGVLSHLCSQHTRWMDAWGCRTTRILLQKSSVTAGPRAGEARGR